jgi:hypothetical protein
MKFDYSTVLWIFQLIAPVKTRKMGPPQGLKALGRPCAVLV